MAQSNVRVPGTTATQAAIAYTAPNGSACSIAVSTSPTYSPLINDLLTDSTSDLARASTVTSGNSRTVIIGARNAPLSGINGFVTQRISNALQTNTSYFYQITCGASTATGQFATTNIPLGLGYGDPWPTDPAAPGAWASPSSPGAIANEQTTDPQTGILVQRATYPGLGYSTGTQAMNTAYDQGQYPCDTAGPWSNPCNAVGTAGYASVTNSTAPVVVRPDNITSDWGDDLGECVTSSTCGGYIQQLQVSITGYCTSATSTKCQLGVAISENAGASAASSVQTVTMPLNTPATVTAGAHNPGIAGIDRWVYDSSPKITLFDSFQYTGNVTVSGSTVTYTGGGNNFDGDWVTGGSGRMRLSNVSTTDACKSSGGSSIETTLASGFGSSVTLTSAPGSYSYYCAQNFAVMINRLVADAGSSVNIQNVSVQYVTDEPGEWMDAGNQTVFAHNSVGGGFLGEILTGGGFGQLSWINPSNGAVSVVGPMVANAKTAGATTSANDWVQQGCPLFSPEIYIAVDDTQPIPTWYCVVTDASGNLAMLKVVYTGSYTSSNTFSQNAAIGTGACVSNADNYSVSCPGAGGVGTATITNLTPSSLNASLSALLTAHIGGPLYIPAAVPMTSCSGGPVQQGNLIVYCNIGQNSMAWIFVVSPGDGVPADAGGAGAHVIASLNTWQYASSRFSVLHSLQDYGQSSPYVGYGPDPMSPGNATLGSTAVVVTSNSSLPNSSGVSCSTWGNPLGITGNLCGQIQISANAGSYEPYYWTATGAQGTTPGIPATAAPGDSVCISESSTTCGYLNLSAEYMMLLQKGVAGDPSQWVFRRGPFAQGNKADTNLKYLFFLPSNFSNTSGVPGWGGMYKNFLSSIPAPIYGNNVIWNYQTDPLGQNAFFDPEGSGGHGFVRPTQVVTSSGLPYSPYTADYNVRHAPNFSALTSIPISISSANPIFSGIVGSAVANVYQSHAGPSGDDATLYEGQAAFDVRPLVGTSNSAPSPVFALVTGNIWSITYTGSNYTDIDDFGGLNRKVYATAANAGTHPLVDVSGPSSNIATAALYTYCVTRAAGECYTGSSVGQIYVNAPGVVYPWCYGNPTSGQSNPQINDICVTNATPVGQGGVQFTTLQSDPLATFQRVLTRTLNGAAHNTSGFASIHVLPDNSWAMFQGNYNDGISRNDYMAKMPPFPPVDSVARSAFVAVPVTLHPPAGLAVNNAIAQFGYQEYGGNCTTRADACIAKAAAIPSGNAPFLFTSENPSGVACSTGCTVTIPAISQRVLYYKVEYRNASNNILSVTPTQVLVTP